jgi:hypothetical protein
MINRFPMKNKKNFHQILKRMEDVHQTESGSFQKETNMSRNHDRRDGTPNSFYWERSQFYFYSIRRGWINQFIKMKYLNELTTFLETKSGIERNSTHKRYKNASLKYINDHFPEFQHELDLYDFSREDSESFLQEEGNEFTISAQTQNSNTFDYEENQMHQNENVTFTLTETNERQEQEIEISDQLEFQTKEMK